MTNKIPKAWLALLLVLFVPAVLLRGQNLPGTVLWTFDAGDLIRSSPAVSQNGTIYFAAGDAFYAITNKGSNSWTFSPGTTGSPAIGRDGAIYYSADALYAINPDGSQKWRYESQGGGGSPAIGRDDTIYVTGGGYVHAVAPNGTNVWRYNFLMGYGTRLLSPTLDPSGNLYVAWFDNRTLYSLRPDSSLAWTFHFPSVPGDSPAADAQGNVYFAGGPAYAFAANGTNLWTSQTNSFAGASPVVAADGTIYVSSDGGSLCAFSSTGQFKWQVLTNGPRTGTSAAIDSAGTIYYLAYSVLYSINAAGGIQWSQPLIRDPGDQFGTSLTSPAIGPDGTIFVTSANRLYAIYNTNRLADSPWPMYRQNARHTGKIEKPSLDKPKKRADANFQFQLYAQIEQTQTVQSSTDLIAWTWLTNVVVTNVPMDVVDLYASNLASRFYRALSQ